MDAPDILRIERILTVWNIILIAGAVFTTVGTIFSIRYNDKIQALKNAELARFQAESKQHIAESNALAEAARADAATARAEEEKSLTERARLELRIQEMEQVHSKLVKSNSANEQKLQALQEAAKPRFISDEQAAKIAGYLKPFAGQAVEIRVFARESEAGIFAERISQVLKGSGLRPNTTHLIVGWGRGVSVIVHDKSSVPPLAPTIQHAFRAAGIDMEGEVLPEHVKQGSFAIAVGSKP